MARRAALHPSTPPTQRRRVIPLDDDTLTPADLRAIEDGRKAFARGDYCTVEEAKAHVARLRRKAGPAKARTRSRA
jgi:hypothetical protein